MLVTGCLHHTDWGEVHSRDPSPPKISNNFHSAQGADSSLSVGVDNLFFLWFRHLHLPCLITLPCPPEGRSRAEVADHQPSLTMLVSARAPGSPHTERLEQYQKCSPGTTSHLIPFLPSWEDWPCICRALPLTEQPEFALN